MWKRTAESLGIATLVIVGVVYFWTENISDAHRLHGANQIEVRSTAGAVDITGDETNDIEVTINGESATNRGVRVAIDRSRKPVRVDIDRIPQNTRVEVRVPADSSLAVTMTAGDLRIRGVKGDIASLLRSGRMTIEAGDAKQFRSADGSVLAGEVAAPLFQRRKGGLFRRFVWSGHGQNTLTAHVSTGQLVIE